MSKLDKLLNQMASERAPVPVVVDELTPQLPAVITPKATASKAKWGSIITAILGAVTAGPVANAVLPEHILASMDFWQYAAWTLLQAAIFYGASFLNIYQAPPNEPIA